MNSKSDYVVYLYFIETKILDYAVYIFLVGTKLSEYDVHLFLVGTKISDFFSRMNTLTKEFILNFSGNEFLNRTANFVRTVIINKN